MKICIISNYSGSLGEGMRNVAFHLNKELSKRHEVLHLSLDTIFSKGFWKKIKDFNPQIIHYVPGPSIKSFMIVRIIKFYNKHAKTVMSAIWPNLHPFDKKIIPLLKPDLILIQSYETERMFIKLGCETKFLPTGVDIERFIPVAKHDKEKLREKYLLDKEKFVILHVGPIKRGRNIQILNKLQLEEDNNQVIIIGSTIEHIEQDIYKSLEESGCIIWRTYFKNIEDIYALSDCYVFPTIDKLNSVELPLSIMEAMSCNLPVISTRFGAVPRIFDEGDGLIFVEKEEDFAYELKKIKNSDMKIRTREKVLSHSWQNIFRKLEEIYSEVLEGSYA